MTLTGRKTLTDDKFIVTSGSERLETPVADNEFDAVLLREFGLLKESAENAYSLADQYIN